MICLVTKSIVETELKLKSFESRSYMFPTSNASPIKVKAEKKILISSNHTLRTGTIFAWCSPFNEGDKLQIVMFIQNEQNMA